MSTYAQIKVWSTSGAIINELFGHSGLWLRAALVPWLLGVVAAIALEQVYWRKIGAEPPPTWLFWVVLAPIPAMIIVPILKYMLLELPIRARELDLTRQMWLTSIVLLGIAAIFAAVDRIQDQLLEYQVTIFEFDDFYLAGTAVLVAGWVVKAIVMAGSYGLFGVIVEYGRIDVRAVLELNRGNLFRFFGLALLLGAAFKGFEELYGWSVQILGLWPEGNAYAPILSEATTYSILAFLIWLPVDLLANILPAVSIGVVYKALREYRLAQP
ncbi:MAG: hypothetical protein O6909_14590 [Alphaproteobacteria bacterium]|nr:hypothetical protein [Alphaproteobacteria bacterium]